MTPLIAWPSYRRDRDTRCMICGALSPAGFAYELHRWGCIEVPGPVPAWSEGVPGTAEPEKNGRPGQG